MIEQVNSSFENKEAIWPITELDKRECEAF